MQGASFAGFVAHELRTPLAVQRALLELALSDPGTDAVGWREVAEGVLDACEQQERLLDACLVLARSQSGLSRRETRDLGSIVARRLRACDLGALKVRSALEAAWVIGDPDLIERLVDNLVGNAIRHNSPGGWIGLSTRRSAAKAVLTVENTGPSIPAGDVARLLQPFQQLAGHNARPAGGLGLGLTVAKAVVDAHGAFIAARARPRGGLQIEVAFQAANRPVSRGVRRAPRG
jgi:signal transduction histidine kinase